MVKLFEFIVYCGILLWTSQNMTLLLPPRFCEKGERENENRIKEAAFEHIGIVTDLLQT